MLNDDSGEEHDSCCNEKHNQLQDEYEVEPRSCRWKVFRELNQEVGIRWVSKIRELHQ